jgi:hypothetical protein
MISEHPSDVKFEIGHVLFLDIVGYSKLLIASRLDIGFGNHSANNSLVEWRSMKNLWAI